uniref:uncharacterized protein LOC117603877 n=1 Tax=Osmia lignaria TaxID=473952 RepID=UPI0014785649|nr:uncharacterized protein LOC117603877 [Osmia lignaria]
MEKLVTKQLDLIERISSTTETMGAAVITTGEVKARLKLLERNWNTFCKTHDQLLVFLATDGNNPYFKQNCMSMCQENYVRQKAVLMDLMEKKLDKTSSGKTKPSPGTSSRRSLPKETLPTCSGNYALIDAQLESLMALKPIKKVSLTSLKRLLKGTTDAVKELKALKRPVQYWDDWLVFITVDRLDPKTRKEWEISIASTSGVPTFAQLTTFLTSRLRTLEAKNVVLKQRRTPVKAPRKNHANVSFTATSSGDIFLNW